MRQVLIGIQARSSSTRLPNKAHLQVGGKAILQWVLDSAQIAARFLRSDATRLDAAVGVAILCPKNDPIVSLYQNRVQVLEGSDSDVLSRYHEAVNLQQADYVVRVTADCLRLPPHHITKHIKAALLKERDYTTNTHFRTYQEGWDCEVLSRRLVEWLHVNAKDPKDREHVTTFIANGKPFPFKTDEGKLSICHIFNSCDESHVKTSIDTREEYEAAEKNFQEYQKKKNEAKQRGIFQT